MAKKETRCICMNWRKGSNKTAQFIWISKWSDFCCCCCWILNKFANRNWKHIEWIEIRFTLRILNTIAAGILKKRGNSAFYFSINCERSNFRCKCVQCIEWSGLKYRQNSPCGRFRIIHGRWTKWNNFRNLFFIWCVNLPK